MSDKIRESFNHLRGLANDIEKQLSGSQVQDQKLRNEIAGMFAVTISATYEGIIKQTLIDYAAGVHPKYKAHVEKEFENFNARISIDHLKSYSQKFSLPEWTAPKAKKPTTIFHKALEDVRVTVERRFRADLLLSYKNIQTWRNAYAHDGSTMATFKDVYNSHRVGKYVVVAFSRAFRSE
ncbi:HEPN domain-containing protein [Roseovarius mucosus]|uniref:HEPN domain-containing protein n=1 Tax=Roseovarius mucosus TaxID=215743 RepID=UPI0035D04585